jgi:hypothetical protein
MKTKLRFSFLLPLLALFLAVLACNPLTIVSQQRSTSSTDANITPVEATVETNDTKEPTALTLKPADSDTPAAGICGSVEGEIVEVKIGSGPDGLPLSGRCIKITPTQQLKLINATAEQVRFSFGPFEVDLPAGGDLLLVNPVGEYLALGVHLLPNAPEIWLVEP